MAALVEHVGRVALSPSRRLAVTLRSESGEPSPMIDLRLQILTGDRWEPTKQGLAVEADALPELLTVLEGAIERMGAL